MKCCLHGLLLTVLFALAFPLGAAAAENAPAVQFVVFYPHTSFRCYSCNKIEALTKAAIEGGKLQGEDGKELAVENAPLAELLKEQKLVFRSVNVEEPGQASLLAELKTKAKMPALAKVEGGKIVAAQPLDQSWKLLAKPEEFFHYVQQETLKFVKANQ